MLDVAENKKRDQHKWTCFLFSTLEVARQLLFGSCRATSSIL